MQFDTPIEVTEESGSSDSDAKQCGTKLVKEGSTIAKTLSTTEIIDVEEVLKEAQEIRKKCKENPESTIVTGKLCNLSIL